MIQVGLAVKGIVAYLDNCEGCVGEGHVTAINVKRSGYVDFTRNCHKVDVFLRIDQ